MTSYDLLLNKEKFKKVKIDEIDENIASTMTVIY